MNFDKSILVACWEPSDIMMYMKTIKVLSVTEICKGDEYDAEALNEYVTVEVEIAGKVYPVGCMVGVPESMWGTAKASGNYASGPMLDAWFADASDWASVSHLSNSAHEELLEALYVARKRLWSEVEVMRAAEAKEADEECESITYSVWDAEAQERLDGTVSTDLVEQSAATEPTGVVNAYRDDQGVWQYIRSDEVEHYRCNLRETVFVVYVLC